MSWWTKLSIGLCVLLILDGVAVLRVRELRTFAQTIIPSCDVRIVAAAEIAVGALSLFLLCS